MSVRQDPEGTYLYVTPVVGVELSDDVHHEFRLNQVTLFSVPKFMRLRRHKLMFSPSRICDFAGQDFWNAPCVAVTRVKGRPDDLERDCHAIVQSELQILSASRLEFHSRKDRGIIAPAGCLDTYAVRSVLIGSDVDLIRRNKHRHTTHPLRINQEFLDIQRDMFFFPLLKAIRGDASFKPKFSGLLKNVAALAGRSQNSVELADAFLWNMIALDQLLLTNNDGKNQLDAFLSHCNALLGHCGCWDKVSMEGRIRAIYKCRCDLVHEGRRDVVRIQHLVFSDRLLSNLLATILRNARFFNSKGKLLQFCRQVEARVELGDKPRPKRWKYIYRRLSYSEKDLREYWAL